MKKNIVLTGFMGVGKTTVGRSLSQKLNMKFVDTDKKIEQDNDMTVSEIFKKYGENKFRELEYQLCKELSVCESTIIATGGGIVKNKENIELLSKNSVVINLYASVDKILENIKDTSTRPLLNNKTKAEIKQMIDEREQYYKNCNFRINVTEFSVMQTMNEIIKIYRRYL